MRSAVIAFSTAATSRRGMRTARSPAAFAISRAGSGWSAARLKAPRAPDLSASRKASATSSSQTTGSAAASGKKPRRISAPSWWSMRRPMRMAGRRRATERSGCSRSSASSIASTSNLAQAYQKPGWRVRGASSVTGVGSEGTTPYAATDEA